MPKHISETVALAEAAAAAATEDGVFPIEFISPGLGSSGYYSREVLEQAAADRVIPAGTHMYADHPTATEDQERPVRSIKDLMAVTIEDARVSESGSLVGSARVVPGWQPFIEAVGKDIGVSIRGSASVSEGEVDGKPCTIIEQLEAPLLSVDFVTRAGRGGRVLSLLESAAAASRAVERGISEATANDLRDALATTLRETYGADKTYVWVRDFDPAKSLVYFEIESDGSETTGVYSQTYSDAGQTLSGDRVEVTVQTSYVPVATTTEASLPTPAGRTTTTTEESEEDTMGNITIEEAEHTRLVEEAGRVTVLESERDTAIRERDTARAELVARRIIGEQKGVIFSELEVRGLVAGMPLKEGALDETAFRATVEAEVKAAQDLHAQVQEAGGVGRVSGFGSTTSTTTGEVSESDLDNAIAGAFGRPVKEA